MPGATAAAATSPARRRWTLRRRLVVVLIALLAAVTGATGVVSTLALRGSLIGPLDSQLLAASARADGEGVTVRVQDDGPGIPEPLRANLLQRFTRGGAGRSPGAGSTGLGLAIVDAVVAAHGGRIAVDTRPGATSFTVSLPAAP